MDIISRFVSLVIFLISRIAGNSATQGEHQVAQKLIKTNFPLILCSSIFFPLISTVEKSGDIECFAADSNLPFKNLTISSPSKDFLNAFGKVVLYSLSKLSGGKIRFPIKFFRK